MNVIEAKTRCCHTGVLLALALAMHAYTAEPAPPAAAPGESKLNTAALEFIGLLEKERFDEAAKRFDPTMQKALSVDQLKAVWMSTIQSNGPMKKSDPGRIVWAGQWDIVDTPCTFEKGKLVVRVTFDKEQRVAGLFLLPHTDPANGRSDLELKTAAGTLFGTLDLPTRKGPWPIVLIIAGSGPTDRDGNQALLKNDSLRLVGKALAEQGIAVLRFDKRGVGKSAAAGTSEEKLRFGDYVDDAAGWIKQLRADKRFNKVAVVGHSEGSLIGMLAAKKAPFDTFVSIAGTGRTPAALLRDQLSRQLPPELLERSNQIIEELQAGRRVNDVPPELMVLFRPSVQPYLITWLNVDPAKEIADLKMPILIVQGTTDVQVSVEDAKLLASSNKGARLVTIENMNHVLKQSTEKTPIGQMQTYTDPSLPLAPKLIDTLSPFLRDTLLNKQK